MRCLDCAAFRPNVSDFRSCGGINPPTMKVNCRAFFEASAQTKKKQLDIFNGRLPECIGRGEPQKKESQNVTRK
jgi:hypothetical protein